VRVGHQPVERAARLDRQAVAERVDDRLGRAGDAVRDPADGLAGADVGVAVGRAVRGQRAGREAAEGIEAERAGIGRSRAVDLGQLVAGVVRVRRGGLVVLLQLIGDGLQTVEEVAELSLIQGVIPNHILGRVNATFEVFSHGIAYPLGALLAAALAETISVRAGIAIGWAGMAISILLLVMSPLPRVRELSDVADVDRRLTTP
jgi:hypothetical protein